MKDRLFREDGFKEFGIVRENVCPRCFTESAPGRRGVAKYFLAFVLVLLCQCFENLGAATVQDPSLVTSENNQIGIDGRESILGDLPNGAEITAVSLGGSVVKGDPDGVIKAIEPSTPLGQGMKNKITERSGKSANAYIDHDSFLGSCLGAYLIVTPLLLFAIFSILFVINLGMPTGFSLAGSFNMEQSLTSINHRLGTITDNKDKSIENAGDVPFFASDIAAELKRHREEARRAFEGPPGLYNAKVNVFLPYTRESKIIDRAERALWEIKNRRPNNTKQENEAMSKKTKKERKKERIRVLKGDLVIARIAVKRQARMIRELKGSGEELRQSQEKIKLLNLKVERATRLRKRAQQATGLALLDAEIARKSKELKASEDRPGGPRSSASSCQAYRGRDQTAKEDGLSAESIKQFHDCIVESQQCTERVYSLLSLCIRQNIPSFDGESLKGILLSAPDELLSLFETSFCQSAYTSHDTPSTPLRKGPPATPQSENSSPECNDQTNQTCTPPVNENFFDDEELL